VCVHVCTAHDVLITHLLCHCSFCGTAPLCDVVCICCPSTPPAHHVLCYVRPRRCCPPLRHGHKIIISRSRSNNSRSFLLDDAMGVMPMACALRRVLLSICASIGLLSCACVSASSVNMCATCVWIVCHTMSLSVHVCTCAWIVCHMFVSVHVCACVWIVCACHCPFPQCKALFSTPLASGHLVACLSTA
jgi:hypothetical protein